MRNSGNLKNLLFGSLTLATLAACNVSVETVSKNQGVNFFPNMPNMYVQSMSATMDSSGYDQAIANIPLGRVKVRPGNNNQMHVQMIAHIATNKQMDEEGLLNLTTRSVEYQGKKVIYNAETSPLPPCKGKSAGFFSQKKTVNGDTTSSLQINVTDASNLENAPCLWKIELKVPMAKQFGLTLNGEVFVDKKNKNSFRRSALKAMFEDPRFDRVDLVPVPN